MTNITGTSEQLAYEMSIKENDTVQITGEVAATLDELKNITAATSGKIILNQATKTANFSGTAADFVTVFDSKIEDYSGNITITGTEMNNEDLKVIESSTSGIVRVKLDK